MMEVKMNETTRTVTMKGNPLTLTGNELKVGDTAPEFEALDVVYGSDDFVGRKAFPARSPPVEAFHPLLA